LVWRITFCVCFAAPDTLFFWFLANMRQCWKGRTLPTRSAIGQIFGGVWGTCVWSLLSIFLTFVRGSKSYFLGVRFGEAVRTCVESLYS
jgi:hypothetical protein